MVLLSLFLLACSGSAPTAGPPALGQPMELGTADWVAAADLDGDGDDSLVLVQGGVARWDGREVELGAQVQVSARGDVDGDGREELLIGCGMGRSLPRAPTRVWLIDEPGARLVWERSVERNQISELRVTPDGVWLAAFTESKVVEGGWLRPGVEAWVFEPQHEVALGTRQLPTEHGVLVGRVYGDEPRSDGDLALHSGEERQLLPSRRGVRALAAVDLSGDGQLELLVGDGWHYRYGTQAEARLRLLDGPGWQQARSIAAFDTEYTVREVEASGSGPQAWLLATGSAQAHLLVRDGLGWRDTVVGPVDDAGSAVIAHHGGHQGILLSGSPARFFPVGR